MNVSVAKIEELLVAIPCKKCGAKVAIKERKEKSDLRLVVECTGRGRHQDTLCSSEKTKPNEYKRTNAQGLLLQLISAILSGNVKFNFQKFRHLINNKFN